MIITLKDKAALALQASNGHYTFQMLAAPFSFYCVVLPVFYVRLLVHHSPFLLLFFFFPVFLLSSGLGLFTGAYRNSFKRTVVCWKTDGSI